MSQLAAILFNGLKREEEFRGDIYDDATGETIKKGTVVIGNPTTGYGFAFNKWPITEPQAGSILQDKSAVVEKWCTENLKYWPNLSLVRQYAIGNIVYQLGGENWLGFTKTNYYLNQGDYNSAYIEILDSAYAQQTPKRAMRMASIIRDDTLVDYYV